MIPFFHGDRPPHLELFDAHLRRLQGGGARIARLVQARSYVAATLEQGEHAFDLIARAGTDFCRITFRPRGASRVRPSAIGMLSDEKTARPFGKRSGGDAS